MAGLAILIPAAGASRRMRGSDKLLAEVDGQSLLRRAAAMAARTGERVIVTLPESGPSAPGRRAALIGLPLQIVPVADAHDGFSASLRAGADHAGPVEGLMVLMPDMPDIEREDLTLLIAAFAEDPTQPLRAATETGVEGHPVIFPRRLLQELRVLTGDRGARVVLEGESVRTCTLPGDRAILDLDTPEDWDAWRRRRED
ncbi:nucleotidyltransferase family protein [Defluviimonas sp. WL0024]|uniref:Nucleotidyltransferase family protein n=1 Tax=Albidovulum salinarum TaxID=2984153 RepID=A0ABT2WYQ1_9RHOB|nr:nucleotidyltransferase family protein [Defluviimonas sp. WL0024]MCU9846811.1 nucleotidyltransferase family protein [Defluviimonas sp. WL0024]